MLKKSVLAVVLLLVATNLWALGPQDVSAGPHNLGVFPAMFDNEDEVCIFCHTPHGGSLVGPLWNRTMPAASGFTHYTSATLSPYMKTTLLTTRNVEPESLLCMSCHDGTIGMNSIINNSNRTGGPPVRAGLPQMFDPSFGLGITPVVGDPVNSLSDDHPISFSYYTARELEPANAGKLHSVADAMTAGLRFFGGGDVNGGRRVECSSCHDPHVNYSATGNSAYAPFLVTPNTGSALCLGCHIK